MTPEAQAERDVIVAFLQDQAFKRFMDGVCGATQASDEIEHLAEAIQRGHHLQPPPQ